MGTRLALKNLNFVRVVSAVGFLYVMFLSGNFYAVNILRFIFIK